MDYRHFIKIVSEHQTPRIKPLYLDNSCATKQIPDDFSNAIIDIIRIIDQYFNELSKGKPIIAIFGLQMACIAIESKLPCARNRIFTVENKDKHFCCTLSYLPTASEDLQQIKDWTHSENLAIDFTSGFIMDKEQYICKALHLSNSGGKTYGQINDQKLRAAWAQVQSRTQH